MSTNSRIGPIKRWEEGTFNIDSLLARLLPAPGKTAGERTEFEDSRMANTIVPRLPGM
jgi:hypothetical protein